MDRTYRAALSAVCPEAADDTLFHRAMVDAAARWNIFHVVWRLPDAIERDRPRGPSTLRQQLLAWIEAFAELSEEFHTMPALGRSARAMAARLRAIWPPEVGWLPTFPAFREENEV